jgi:hypothetical protein
MQSQLDNDTVVAAIFRAMKFGVRADLSDLDTRIEAVCAAGLLALRNVAVNHFRNMKIVERENGIPLIVTALRNFPENPEVQEGALGLLRSLAKSSEEVRCQFSGKVLGFRSRHRDVWHCGQERTAPSVKILTGANP